MDEPRSQRTDMARPAFEWRVIKPLRLALYVQTARRAIMSQSRAC
jgi:hypothetical protein